MGPLTVALLTVTFAAPAPDAATRPTRPDVTTPAKRGVVFMVDDQDPTTRAVVTAVEAQLADLDAALALEPMPASTRRQDQLSAARAHALQHQAVGVFWVEVEDSGDLMLHLVDPEGIRMLVRRVEASPESDTAAVQTVAVIARGFTSALLEGRSIGLSPVESPAEPTPEVAQPEAPELKTQPEVVSDPEPVDAPRERGQLLLSSAYYGGLIAPQREWRWQNGLAIATAWQWKPGIYAGLGYDVTERLTNVTRSEAAMNVISSQVRRNPASVLLGYQYGVPKSLVSLEAELRFIVDVHTVKSQAEVADSLESKNSRYPFYMLSPRAGFHFAGGGRVSVHLTVGAEIVLKGENFTAVFEDSDTEQVVDQQTFLTPRIVRPIVLGGVRFYL